MKRLKIAVRKLMIKIIDTALYKHHPGRDYQHEANDMIAERIKLKREIKELSK